MKRKRKEGHNREGKPRGTVKEERIRAGRFGNKSEALILEERAVLMTVERSSTRRGGEFEIQKLGIRAFIMRETELRDCKSLY